MTHLDKYIEYLHNTGGSVTVAEFDEDWEPIGFRVRKDLLENGMIHYQDGRIYPVQKTRRIYVASSWRNTLQPSVVKLLCEYGFEVYDFRDHGFGWDQITEDWQSWTFEEYRQSLDHPTAIKGYEKDMNAMIWADTFVLVQPCGCSAHLELGWAVGRGKKTIMYQPELDEPELMVKMCDHLVNNTSELLEALGVEN